MFTYMVYQKRGKDINKNLSSYLPSAIPDSNGILPQWSCIPCIGPDDMCSSSSGSARSGEGPYPISNMGMSPNYAGVQICGN